MAKNMMISDDDDGRRRLLWIFLLLALPLAAAQSPPAPPGGEPPSGAYGFNTRFNPSMAIIIVVLISAFFFMGFFSIYIRQCAGENSSVRGAGGQGGRGGRSRRAARGLDPAVIETFPTFEYSVVKNLKLGKATLECAVCLSEFDDDETLRLLPKCSHVFHPDCIDAWLSSHTTCPVCRSNLVPGPDDDPAAEPVTEPAEGEAGTGTEGSRHEVAITIDESQPPTTAAAPADQTQLPPNLILPFQNRPPRSKSTRRPKWAGKFPRSHSTGHSLIQPGENVERFTLRLPEQLRQELVTKTKLNRTTSCAYPSEALVSDGSVRRGLRILGGEGSSRGGRSINRSDSAAAKSDRWVFSMAPPFFTRSFSVRSPSKRGAAVKTPFDCINGAKAGADPEELPEPQRSATPVFTVQTPP